MRWLLFFCVGLLPLLTQGCQVGRNIEDPHLLVSYNQAKDFGYTIVWAKELDVPAGDEIKFSEVLGDLVILVEKKSRIVTGLNEADGNIRWRAKVGEDLDALYRPMRLRDEVYVSSGTAVYVIDANDGTILRRQPLSEVVETSPTQVLNYGVFSGAAGIVFAQDLLSGQTRWRYRMSAGMECEPIQVEQSTFLADSKGTYRLLNIQDGKVLWSGYTFGKITAQPVATDAAVVVASEDNTIYGINWATGKDIWNVSTQERLVHDLSRIDQTVFVPMPDGTMRAYDSFDGRLIWTINHHAEGLGYLLDEFLMLTNGRMLELREPSTGKLVDELKLREPSFVHISEGDLLILTGKNGRVMKVQPRF